MIDILLQFVLQTKQKRIFKNLSLIYMYLHEKPCFLLKFDWNAMLWNAMLINNKKKNVVFSPVRLYQLVQGKRTN